MNRTVRPLIQLLLTGTALTSPLSVGAGELPRGASTVHGGVSISNPSGNQMTIQQTTSSAIVNWQGFSIGQGARVDINQPSASSAILNRVTGSTPSTIAGQLNANGQVYLVNPNGIAITKSGSVQAGAFVASTLDTSDQEFKAGKRVFRGTGQSATVSNQGTITVQKGGYAALLGGRVENSGLISVPMGKVGLGAGEQATLDFSGDGFLQVAVPSRKDGSDAALIQHSGEIRASGGTVVMQAATARDAARNAINLSGLVEARSVSGRSGAIVLGGGEGGSVTVSGKLDTSAKIPTTRQATAGKRVPTPAQGGAITVTGNDLRLSGATLMANGAVGGGRIRVGGDYQGRGPLQRASTTTVDAATTISANAGMSGNGGDVVIWSDQMTRFVGRISATGGEQGGNGGQAEVSSKGVLGYDGTTILTAARGSFGTLLLDPYNVTISNGPDTNSDLNSTSGGCCSLGSASFTPTGNDSVINAAILQNALQTANVTVTTGGAGSPGTQAGDITVAAPVTWGTGTRGQATTLTLSAYRSIIVNANLTVDGAGGLALNTNQGGTEGALTFGNGASATFTTSDPSGVIPAPGQSLTINSNPYTLLYSMGEIDGIDGTSASSGAFIPQAEGLGGRYALARSLVLDGTIYTNAPVATGAGSSASSGIFTGSFEGLGHTIDRLTIVSGDQNVGMFGAIQDGTVSNLRLTNVDISSTFDRNDTGYLGGLAGRIDASSASASALYNVDTVFVSGRVDGAAVAANDFYAGGLIGFSDARVGRVATDISIRGGDTLGVNTSSYVGGLIGFNIGSVFNATSGNVVTGGNATADYTSEGATDVTRAFSRTITGGLIGYNNGSVAQSISSASVNGGTATATYNSNFSENLYGGNKSSSEAYAGGLIGLNLGNINNSSAAGSVRGGTAISAANFPNVFGIEGREDNFSAFADSFTGGLSGYNNGSIAVANATGTVITGNAAYRLNVETGVTAFVSEDALVGGLVGYNIGLIDATNASGNVTGGNGVGSVSYVGGLIGRGEGGVVRRSFATGSVATNVENPFVSETGGFIGENRGNISDSYSSGTVQATSTQTPGSSGGRLSTGGFAGSNVGSIERVYSIGSVTASAARENPNIVAGLVGRNEGSINQAYATGSVTDGSLSGGAAERNIGGLIGFVSTGATVNQTYATGNVSSSGSGNAGGLIGSNQGNISASFWDTVTTGQAQAAGNVPILPGATGLTTSLFQNPDSFVPLARAQGWNFETTWAPPSLGNYPQLYSVNPVIYVAGNDVSRQYGQPNPALSGTTYGGPGVYVFDTAPAGPIDAASLLTSSTTPVTDVGRYPFAPVSPFTSQTGTAYRVTSTGALTIIQAPLTIAANNQAKTYGTTFSFAGTEFTTTGLQNGETLTQADFSSDGQPSTANAGAYAINIGNARGGTANLNNYDLSYVPGTLTVNRAAASVIANNQAKTYGTAFTFAGNEFTTTGLQNGETLTQADLASVGQPSTANAGAYAITVGNARGGTANLNNYDLSYVPGTLTVNRAAASVIANNQAKNFGTNFIFTGNEFTTTGLQNGETLTQADLTSAGQPSTANAGAYRIDIGNARGGTANPNNYDLSYVPGTLSVNQSSVQSPSLAEQASTLANATYTPNVQTFLPPFTTPSLNLVDVINLAGPGDNLTLGGGGPTLGVGQGSSRGLSGDTGDGSSTVTSGNKTLAAINTASANLEAKLSNCDKSSNNSANSYTACVGGSLESFADELDLQVQQLPPAFRSLPAVIRQAAERVRAAPAIVAARGLTGAAARAAIIAESRAAVRVAVAAVRKTIALLRADEPAVARVQVRQGQAIASALQTVDTRLSKAVGL